ncbi:histidine kinase-like ATPase [Baffinella frigidus]|nr:histidine kinase-like ATPase [Cryptophyta sp. CCMP2293]
MQEAPPAVEVEKFEFQAEVSRVMDIIINSLYSDKDVFLRELVSNAADACDKKRFLAVSEGKGAADNLEVRAPPSELQGGLQNKTRVVPDRSSLTLPRARSQVRITADKERKLLIIEDAGVGLTKEEMIANLGRIAQSGTKQFSEMLKAKERKKKDGEDDMNLIGQFGVGFYSGFLVADKITVISKGLNDMEAGSHKWESEAGSGYSITKVEGDEEITGESGTRLILHLREDAEEYADDFKVLALPHSS